MFSLLLTLLVVFANYPPRIQPPSCLQSQVNGTKQWDDNKAGKSKNLNYENNQNVRSNEFPSITKNPISNELYVSRETSFSSLPENDPLSHERNIFDLKFWTAWDARFEFEYYPKRFEFKFGEKLSRVRVKSVTHLTVPKMLSKVDGLYYLQELSKLELRKSVRSSDIKMFYKNLTSFKKDFTSGQKFAHLVNAAEKVGNLQKLPFLRRRKEVAMAEYQEFMCATKGNKIHIGFAHNRFEVFKNTTNKILKMLLHDMTPWEQQLAIKLTKSLGNITSTDLRFHDVLSELESLVGTNVFCHLLYEPIITGEEQLEEYSNQRNSVQVNFEHGNLPYLECKSPLKCTVLMNHKFDTDEDLLIELMNYAGRKDLPILNRTLLDESITKYSNAINGTLKDIFEILHNYSMSKQIGQARLSKRFWRPGSPGFFTGEQYMENQKQALMSENTMFSHTSAKLYAQYIENFAPKVKSEKLKRDLQNAIAQCTNQKCAFDEFKNLVDLARQFLYLDTYISPQRNQVIMTESTDLGANVLNSRSVEIMVPKFLEKHIIDDIIRNSVMLLEKVSMYDNIRFGLLTRAQFLYDSTFNDFKVFLKDLAGALPVDDTVLLLTRPEGSKTRERSYKFKKGETFNLQYESNGFEITLPKSLSKGDIGVFVMSLRAAVINSRLFSYEKYALLEDINIFERENSEADLESLLTKIFSKLEYQSIRCVDIPTNQFGISVRKKFGNDVKIWHECSNVVGVSVPKNISHLVAMQMGRVIKNAIPKSASKEFNKTISVPLTRLITDKRDYPNKLLNALHIIAGILDPEHLRNLENTLKEILALSSRATVKYVIFEDSANFNISQDLPESIHVSFPSEIHNISKSILIYEVTKIVENLATAEGIKANFTYLVFNIVDINETFYKILEFAARYFSHSALEKIDSVGQEIVLYNQKYFSPKIRISQTGNEFSVAKREGRLDVNIPQKLETRIKRDIEKWHKMQSEQNKTVSEVLMNCRKDFLKIFRVFADSIPLGKFMELLNYANKSWNMMVVHSQFKTGSELEIFINDRNVTFVVPKNISVNLTNAVCDKLKEMTSLVGRAIVIHDISEANAYSSLQNVLHRSLKRLNVSEFHYLSHYIKELQMIEVIVRVEIVSFPIINFKNKFISIISSPALNENLTTIVKVLDVVMEDFPMFKGGSKNLYNILNECYGKLKKPSIKKIIEIIIDAETDNRAKKNYIAEGLKPSSEHDDIFNELTDSMLNLTYQTGVRVHKNLTDVTVDIFKNHPAEIVDLIVVKLENLSFNISLDVDCKGKTPASPQTLETPASSNLLGILTQLSTFVPWNSQNNSSKTKLQVKSDKNENTFIERDQLPNENSKDGKSEANKETPKLNNWESIEASVICDPLYKWSYILGKLTSQEKSDGSIKMNISVQTEIHANVEKKAGSIQIDCNLRGTAAEGCISEE